MLRPTFLLALAGLACAPKSDGAATEAAPQPGEADPAANPVVLAYDAARVPGTYSLSFVFGPGAQHSDGGVRFELRPRPDTRFDLFVTQLREGTLDIDDPRLSAHPVHDLSIDARGPADARFNPEGFLKDGSDLAESFMFLLPQTPAGPVDVGATWTGTRTLPLGKLIPEHPDVAITHQLLRFEACNPPSDPQTCAVYQFEADTGLQSVTVDDQTISYTYRFGGTGRFSTTGHLVESKAKLEGSVTFDDQAPLEITVNYELSHR